MVYDLGMQTVLPFLLVSSLSFVAVRSIVESRPCTSAVRCFGVVRDDEDSTINGCAWALNAKKVLSNKIAIPIHPVVLLSLLLVFAVFYVHRRRKC
jgi:hypothetical protein